MSQRPKIDRKKASDADVIKRAAEIKQEQQAKGLAALQKTVEEHKLTMAVKVQVGDQWVPLSQVLNLPHVIEVSVP
jgi:hypothetical protein